MSYRPINPKTGKFYESTSGYISSNKTQVGEKTYLDYLRTSDYKKKSIHSFIKRYKRERQII